MLAHFNINTPITLTYKACAFDIGAVTLHNRQYLEVEKYGTAQRQLDTCIHAANWILSGEDYIMHLIFEWPPVMFVPTSGKSSGVFTRKHYTHFEWTFNKTYNINSVYYINLRILFLYAPIKPWIHCPTEKLPFVCSTSCPTIWLNVENGFSVENGSFIGDWISINLFAFHQSVGWKVRKYFIS